MKRKKRFFFIGAKVALSENHNQEITKLLRGTIISGESKMGPDFCLVTFEELNINIDFEYIKLKPIKDEYYLKRRTEFKEIRKELNAATDIVYTVGPRGAFKFLQYKCVFANGAVKVVNNKSKKESMDLLMYFHAIGKETRKEQA